jgi:hypothetical protein
MLCAWWIYTMFGIRIHVWDALKHHYDDFSQEKNSTHRTSDTDSYEVK